MFHEININIILLPLMWLKFAKFPKFPDYKIVMEAFTNQKLHYRKVGKLWNTWNRPIKISIEKNKSTSALVPLASNS